MDSNDKEFLLKAVRIVSAGSDEQCERLDRIIQQNDELVEAVHEQTAILVRILDALESN